MSQPSQPTGLSGKQWLFLLVAFLMGSASTFVINQVLPEKSPSSQVVQAATQNP